MRAGFLAVLLLAAAAAPGCLDESASEPRDADPTNGTTSSTAPTSGATATPSSSTPPSPTPAPSPSPAPTPSPTPSPTPPPPTPDEVSIVFNLTGPGHAAHSFAIDPAEVNLTFPVLLNVTLHNLDPPGPTGLNHSFRLPDFEVSVPPVPPGGNATFEILIDRAGTFAYACGETGHSDLGMAGELRVVALE